VKINRGREAGASSEDRTDAGSFTGTVWADPVLREVPGVNVNTVFFAHGGRTHWHRHTQGQLLLVSSGAGVVQSRGGGAARIGAGDVVHSDPGEEHWHGSGRETMMVHTAVSLGLTEWLEEVSEEHYRAALDG